ncbi:MAG: MFS transporter [Lactimicrobium sp.]|jgi:predicted MFS family arabinose efflux permease|uniref:MFS transporter n=1 Tax=Lactimicrobium sp. TaxID=2563780 RepID=UPI002F355179
MEQNEQGQSVLHFSLLDGFFWAFFACFSGMAGAYFLSCGMANTALSITLAGYMLGSFLGSFLLGRLCDHLASNRKVFLPVFAISALVSFLSFFLAKTNLVLAAILYILFGFLCLPLGSSLDAWMLRSFQNDGGKYGRARSCGSACYAFAMLIMGIWVKKQGYDVMPIAMGVLAILILIFAIRAKEMPYPKTVSEKKQAGMKDLMHIQPYIFLLAIILLCGLSVSPINNLKIVILKSVGGDVGILGLDSFIGVMIQALCIMMAGPMQKINSHLRLVLMSVSLLASMLLIVFAINPAMVILSTCFVNLSYGLMLVTQRQITEESVMPDLRTTAHSLCDTMYSGVSGTIALMYSGAMMDHLGAKSPAVLGLFLTGAAVIMSLVPMLKKRK